MKRVCAFCASARGATSIPFSSCTSGISSSAVSVSLTGLRSTCERDCSSRRSRSTGPRPAANAEHHGEDRREREQRRRDRRGEQRFPARAMSRLRVVSAATICTDWPSMIAVSVTARMFWPRCASSQNRRSVPAAIGGGAARARRRQLAAASRAPSSRSGPCCRRAAPRRPAGRRLSAGLPSRHVHVRDDRARDVAEVQVVGRGEALLHEEVRAGRGYRADGHQRRQQPEQQVLPKASHLFQASTR